MSDRAREGLFSSLGSEVRGARVLDLFAGTGAMGIEALSRGASSAVFVDSAPSAVKVIGENLARTRLSRLATVRRQDAIRAIRTGLGGPFDILLIDPPYRLPGPDLDALLQEIAGQGLVNDHGLVLLTRPGQGYTPVIPINWHTERRLSYGAAALFVFRIPRRER
jgi:16S rRNA (guanine966-N2)-methyltransferase